MYLLTNSNKVLYRILNKLSGPTNILNLHKKIDTSNNKLLLTVGGYKQSSAGNTFGKNKVLISKIFKTYLNISFYAYTSNTKIHPSFIHMYLLNSTKGSNLVNINKFFSVWLNVCTYIYNIYFYNLNPILFGTSFFKKEVYSLNWFSLPKLKTNWKYSKLFLFLVPTSKSGINSIVYKLLNIMGLTNSIVLDVNYHKSTLNHLNKLSIFTLGIVPTIYNIKCVDLALPVNIDNVFTQLFTIRLVVKLIKLSENNKYLNSWSLWSRINTLRL